MRIAVIILLSLVYSIGSAQNVEFKKENFLNNIQGFNEAMDNMMDGNEYYVLGKNGYNAALQFFLKANDFNPSNALLNYKIGICYLSGGNKSKALDFMQKAYALDKNVAFDIHFRLGQAFQYQLRYDEALEEYIIFKNVSKGNALYSDYEAKLAKHIEECKHGFVLISKTVKGEIQTIGNINSPYPDYCPLISADEKVMIFTSRRPETTGGMEDPDELSYYEDVYISHKEGESWSAPKNIGNPINTRSHDATVGLSADGQELYIYIGSTGGGDLYVCKLKGDKWSDPKPLPAPINSDARESSASISADGNTLYFISDRTKGYGRDIFRCTRDKNGKWGDVERLPDKINSVYDEEGIFIHPDNKTLYYSSMGSGSMGGYDIFYAVYQADGTWSDPVNLGYPINTADDDLYFTMTASGLHGYFSSGRSGGEGHQDIYLIDYTETVSPMGIVNITLIKGFVKDQQGGLPVEAEIEITDNEKNELVALFISNSATGEYLVTLPSGHNYGINVKAAGFLFHSENFNIPASAAFSEIVMDINLQKIDVGSKMILKNIFFDYASDSLKSESIAELERVYQFMMDNPNMRIEIGGHTDNQSSRGTNVKLSQARAKSVVMYLVKRGIDKSRLEYKGYAFDQPIATNDTDEGKALNRRVEFKILSK